MVSERSQAEVSRASSHMQPRSAATRLDVDGNDLPVQVMLVNPWPKLDPLNPFGNQYELGSVFLVSPQKMDQLFLSFSRGQTFTTIQKPVSILNLALLIILVS